MGLISHFGHHVQKEYLFYDRKNIQTSEKSFHRDEYNSRHIAHSYFSQSSREYQYINPIKRQYDHHLFDGLGNLLYLHSYSLTLIYLQKG